MGGSLSLASIGSASARPLPVPDLGHVFAMLLDVLAVFDQPVAQFLNHVGRALG
jgi:hypothetical protein